VRSHLVFGMGIFWSYELSQQTVVESGVDRDLLVSAQFSQHGHIE